MKFWRNLSHVSPQYWNTHFWGFNQENSIHKTTKLLQLRKSFLIKENQLINFRRPKTIFQIFLFEIMCQRTQKYFLLVSNSEIRSKMLSILFQMHGRCEIAIEFLKREMTLPDHQVCCSSAFYLVFTIRSNFLARFARQNRLPKSRVFSSFFAFWDDFIFSVLRTSSFFRKYLYFFEKNKI